MSKIDFEGTVSWYKGFESNRDMGENLQDGDQKDKMVSEHGHYNAIVTVTEETRKAMIDAGCTTKGMIGNFWQKQNDDGTWDYKIKRPHFNTKVNKGEGKVMGPPITVDTENVPWDTDVEVGNGSKCKIRLDNWNGKILTWEATRVIELVEFVPDSDPLSGF